MPSRVYVCGKLNYRSYRWSSLSLSVLDCFGSFIWKDGQVKMSVTDYDPKTGEKLPIITRPRTDDTPYVCVTFPLQIISTFIIALAFVRVMNNTASKLDSLICYGALAYCILMVILGSLMKNRDR
jgi:hypothetical protein